MTIEAVVLCPSCGEHVNLKPPSTCATPEVHSDLPSGTTWRGTGDMQLRRIRPNDPIQIRVREELVATWESLTIQQAVVQLLRFADGKVEARIEYETDYGATGDDRDRDLLVMVGWRTASNEEIAAMRQERAEDARQRQDWNRTQLERLKRESPELFA